MLDADELDFRLTDDKKHARLRLAYHGADDVELSVEMTREQLGQFLTTAWHAHAAMKESL